MGYLALKKSVVPSKLGRAGAAMLALLYFVFAINHVLSFFEIYIANYLGNNYSIIMSFIGLFSTAILVFSAKVWTPVKISAVLYWIPILYGFFCIGKINLIYEMADEKYDYITVERMLKSIEICDYIAIGIVILTVVLATVWIGRNPTARQAKTNQINNIII